MHYKKECEYSQAYFLLGSVEMEEAQEEGTQADAADDQVLSRPADGGAYLCTCVYAMLHIHVPYVSLSSCGLIFIHH